MITRYISDEDLIAATALVSDSMLRALPEPEDCVGQFSKQFEERIEKLKKSAVRKAIWLKFKKSIVAAVLVVLIGFSMICVFNTEVRAAVVEWFKETFETYTTYWFQSEDDYGLPEYDLTWIPDGYEIIYDDKLSDSRTIIYQCGDDISASFSFSYYLAEDDSPLAIYTLDGDYSIEKIQINNCYGEYYGSNNPSVSNAVVWLDEETNTVNTIIAYLSKGEILEIARNTKNK